MVRIILFVVNFMLFFFFWVLDCCVVTGFSARHVLCEKQGKINEAYKKLQDGWLDNGDKVPPAEFAKVSGRCTCSSA